MQKLNKKFGYNVTSQHGEDGIIRYIIRNVEGISKTCVEFGAWDGKFLSNTFSLWHDENWKGILIEADNKRCATIERKYANCDIEVFNQFIEPSGVNSIDYLFKKNKIDGNVGVMSIDIDSTDYHVWKKMKEVRPQVILIEHNNTIPAYIDYNDPEGEIFMLCSAKALERLGKEKNYKLICCTLTNSIFVDNEIFSKSVFPDLPVEQLFDYSGCSTPVLSASLGLGNNFIPVFGGTPTMTQKIFVSLKRRIKAILTKKKYEKPSKKTLTKLKESGLTI